MLKASLQVEEAIWAGNILRLSLRNNSDANFQLRNLSEHLVLKQGPVIEAAPNDITIIEFQFSEPSSKVSMQFEVLNTLIAPNKAGVLEFNIDT